LVLHLTSMKKVALIILTYNGKKYLPSLLGSIFDFSEKSVSTEIMIVDNNSSDGTVEYVRQNFPEATVFAQDKNLGFAAGNNIGIKYAMDTGTDFIMLLNQDTIVTENFLKPLIEQLESDEKIAAVQPKLMLYPLTELVNSLGNVIHYLGFGYTYGHKTKIKELWPMIRDTKFRIHEINYCSGAACLIKTEALKNVGLLDEDLFMYHEDLDLGWRFKLKGYKNIACLDSVVYHQYEFSRSIQKYYFMERNRFIVMFKNYRWLTILLIFPALIFMEIGLFIFSFKNGWWRQKLLVYAYFLNPLNWIKIFNKRQVVQHSRVISDREIVRYFSGRIEHQEINNPVLRIVNPFFYIYWQIVKKLIL